MCRTSASGTSPDAKLNSGVTVVLCDEPAVRFQVLGGAPGTRETDLLEPQNSVERVNAIVLSGGSAFGLDAAPACRPGLREQGIGFEVRRPSHPDRARRILFDLLNGGDKDWGRYPPYRELGYEPSTRPRASSHRHGRRGIRRADRRAEGRPRLGLDRAARRHHRRRAGGGQPDRLGHARPHAAFLGGALRDRRRVRRPGLPKPMPANAPEILLKAATRRSSPTPRSRSSPPTQCLPRRQAKRLAIAAHDGFARAIWPTHTPTDGDLVFALATGASGTAPDGEVAIDLYAAAGATMARAIARAVHAATPRAMSHRSGRSDMVTRECGGSARLPRPDRQSCGLRPGV